MVLPNLRLKFKMRKNSEKGIYRRCGNYRRLMILQKGIIAGCTKNIGAFGSQMVSNKSDGECPRMAGYTYLYSRETVYISFSFFFYFFSFSFISFYFSLFSLISYCFLIFPLISIYFFLFYFLLLFISSCFFSQNMREYDVFPQRLSHRWLQ